MVRKILAILIAGWFVSTSLASADDKVKCTASADECETQIREMLAGRKYIGMKFARASGGILVTNVASGSPGERAGMRAGDRIVTINDRDCTTAKVTIVKEILNATREGYKVSFTVDRSGYFRRFDVRVEVLSKQQIDKAVAAHLREAHANPGEPRR
jgi:Periplasmic protease